MKIPQDGPARPHPAILIPAAAGQNVIDRIADYCEDLRKKNSRALGFIPAIAYTDAAARNRMVVELENDEPCGFAFWARRRQVIRIHQCCIQPDARRVKHATQLVAATLAQPDAVKAKRLRLRVADDLEANHFWQSIGCRIVGNQPGGKTWNRTINLYEMQVGDRMKVAERLITANLAHERRVLDRQSAKDRQSKRGTQDRALQECNPSGGPPGETEGGGK